VEAELVALPHTAVEEWLEAERDLTPETVYKVREGNWREGDRLGRWNDARSWDGAQVWGQMVLQHGIHGH
jgi:hypothetical protein